MTTNMEAALGHSQRRPWLFEFRSSKGFILATVCVAIFTDAFLYGVVVPVLPFSLRDRSGVPDSEVQWWTSFIFAVFGAAILIASPICGWFADRTSDRSLTYYTGLAILLAATLLFGLAKQAWLLVVSRLFQGLSAAIVYTVGLAILVDTVGRDNIGQWMGTALSSSSIGLIISPFLGGIVYQTAGYMAVFAMAMALITIDIIMRILMIDTLSAKKYLSNEQTNILNGDASAYNTFANQTENGDPSSPGSEAELDRLLSTPQATRLPAIFTLLRSPRALAAIYGIFVNVSILATFDGILPLFLKMTFHWNSLAAGLVFLCIAVPALTGPLVGMLSDRFGPRWITVAGSAATAVPLILMRLVQGDSLEQKVLLCFLLFLCGCTLILIVSPVAADLSTVVEELEKDDPGAFGPGGAYAQAFALFNCSMAAATMFGPIVAGWLSEEYGWKTTTLCMGIFSASGAVPSLFFTGGWLFQKQEEAR